MMQNHPPGVTSDVWLIYKNHRGEVALRHIVPLFTEYTSTEWYPEKTWIMHAFDLDKQEQRGFALASVLTFDVPPNHPARCDEEKWEVMREALERGDVEADVEQALPRGGDEPVFPVLRRLMEQAIHWEWRTSEAFAEEIARLLERVKARESYGLRKYKQTLMTHDGRDNMKDCEDELLDLAVYTVKARMESKDGNDTRVRLWHMYELLRVLNTYPLDAKPDEEEP